MNLYKQEHGQIMHFLQEQKYSNSKKVTIQSYIGKKRTAK